MKTIIELAREAGMPIDDDSFIFQATRERVTRFAALIRAVALEEAAGVCETNADRWPGTSKVYAAMECAAAIRALKGEQE